MGRKAVVKKQIIRHHHEERRRRRKIKEKKEMKGSRREYLHSRLEIVTSKLAEVAWKLFGGVTLSAERHLPRQGRVDLR